MKIILTLIKRLSPVCHLKFHQESAKGYSISVQSSVIQNKFYFLFFFDFLLLFFVCDEVFWSSQPDGVISSVVSLPNHTFTGQA